MTTRSDASYRLEGKRVWVAGHRGMVGAAVVRRLASERCEILTVGRGEVDLRRQAEVERWMQRASPQAVVLAAATVGGILANDTQAGRIPLRQPRDPDQHHARGEARGRREAPVPRLVLHLSAPRRRSRSGRMRC